MGSKLFKYRLERYKQIFVRKDSVKSDTVLGQLIV